MASIAELKKDFTRLLEKETLTHGYILFGHESSEGRIVFAKELANLLENKKWEVGERLLSDALIVDAREEAGIDLIRSASHFLWQKPVSSPRRTLIIDRAEELTISAQNAILKIAEEPPEHALIILLVKDPDILLSAVQSRFQKIFIHNTNLRMSVNDTNKIVRQFFRAVASKRKEIIKEVIENETILEDFIAGMIAELAKNKEKNWKILKELLRRWTLIKRFNVNKKLQLEAALLNI